MILSSCAFVCSDGGASFSVHESSIVVGEARLCDVA